MVDDLLAPPPPWQRWLRVLVFPVSIGLHVLAAIFILRQAAQAKVVDQWIEMAVVAPPPPPEPPPEPPKPEPPKPRPAPKPVDFKDTIPESRVKEAPPPERVVRKIQGLSASSFAVGAGTGVSVRAGTTTAVAATEEVMGLDEANGAVPVSIVTTQPRNCSKPSVIVPKEAIDNNIEGTLQMSLDLDANGSVSAVRLVGHMGYGIDEACIAAARQIRCKPARQGGEPVPVTGYPHRCTIKAID